MEGKIFSIVSKSGKVVECSTLRFIIRSWPHLSEILEKNNLNYTWYEEFKYIYNLKQRAHTILCSMSSRLYKQIFTNSDFREWLEIYREKPQAYYYLVDNLMSIVNTHSAIRSTEAAPIR